MSAEHINDFLSKDGENYQIQKRRREKAELAIQQTKIEIAFAQDFEPEAAIRLGCSLIRYTSDHLVASAQIDAFEGRGAKAQRVGSKNTIAEQALFDAQEGNFVLAKQMLSTYQRSSLAHTKEVTNPALRTAEERYANQLGYLEANIPENGSPFRGEFSSFSDPRFDTERE